jgi:hypothetical protein
MNIIQHLAANDHADATVSNLDHVQRAVSARVAINATRREPRETERALRVRLGAGPVRVEFSSATRKRY